VTATDTSNAAAFGDFALTVANVNDAPLLAQPIANQSAAQGAAFNFTVPAGAFIDPDTGDTLSYSAKLSSGAALPSWLTFNAATRTFSGTPANVDVGTLNLVVTAADSGGLTASGGFALTVANVNDAPVLAQPIANQSTTQGAAFGFTVPTGTFTDPDTGDTLTYSAKLSSGAALPAWLSFDAATRTFSGTPANADVGAISVRVTATDTSNAAVSGDFTLTVANVNDAPVLATPTGDQAATQDAAFSFTIPAGTFTDPDAGDTLTYSARLASGAALPKWLSFDAATGTFSGTPANADVGALNLVVTATDRGGLAANGNFALVVANVNDAPVLARAIGTQTAAPDVAFGFALPAATFTDPDVGDTLSYSASLASGAPLPAWLSFDPATKSFVGTPGGGDLGQYAVRLMATDAAGAAAQAVFVIRVAVAVPTLTIPTPDTAPATPVTVAAPSTEQTTAAPTTTAVAAPLPSPGRLGATDAAVAASDKGAETSIVVTGPRGDDAALAATRPGSRSDAVLADAVTPLFSELAATPLSQLLRNDDLQRKFEEMQRQMDEGADTRRTIAESGVAISAGLSIGYVVWLVRGGVLLSSVLSALPAWQMVDPLPVLAATRKDDRRGAGQTDEPEVERLFDESSHLSASAGRDTLASRPAALDKNAALRTAGTPADQAGSKETRG
jgi:hypothetical protein